MALLDLANGILLTSGSDPAVVLEPTADAAALAAASVDGSVVAIRFPTFGDGRGHSLAVLLRERHGFDGEIRWDTSKPDGQPRRRVDPSRAADAFGFAARTPFDDGLRSTEAKP